jgi:hypothetical protein
MKVKVKVKFALEQAVKAQGGSRGTTGLLVFNVGSGKGWVVGTTLVGPQGRFERIQGILSPPGLDPRTVQSLASRYTDHAG